MLQTIPDETALGNEELDIVVPPSLAGLRADL